MHLHKYYTLIFGLFLLTSCKVKEDITQYAPTETYPEDEILDKLNNKKAMIVIAHDDDMCGMSGTISMLNEKNWEINVLSFTISEERNKAHQKACENILDSVQFFSITNKEYRNDLESNQKLHQAIAKIKFKKILCYQKYFLLSRANVVAMDVLCVHM